MSRRALILFTFVDTLLQKREIVRRIFNVAVLVLEESFGILGQPHEFLGGNLLVAQRHFPVKVQQVARSERPDAKATLQLHLRLGARDFLKGTRHLGHDAKHLEFLDGIGDKFLEFRALHHDRFYRVNF